ncbi:MAG: hypothetical protein ACJ0HC_02960 [Gammaproteobacteria bacterium]
MGSNDFIDGKNEPAVQNYHAWIKDCMSKEGSDWVALSCMKVIDIHAHIGFWKKL